jgi:hypothetical protein
LLWVCVFRLRAQVKLTDAKDRQNVLEENTFPINNSREWDYSVEFDAPSPMCAVLVEFYRVVPGKKKGHKHKKPYGQLQDLLLAQDFVKWYAHRAALLWALARVCLLAYVRAHFLFCTVCCGAFQLPLTSASSLTGLTFLRPRTRTETSSRLIMTWDK